MSEYDTKPTIESVLEKMAAGFAQMNSRFDGLEARLDRLEKRMIREDERIDNFIEEVIDLKRTLRSTV